MTRRVLVVLAVVVAVGLLAFGLLRPAGGGGRSSAIGQVAPLFESTDVNGRQVALRDLRGQRVLINFWASWCTPCRSEFPILQRLVAHHHDLVLLGVVFQDNDTAARNFLKTEAATWPGVRDPKGQIARAYDVHDKPGIPVSILIDPSGRVRQRQIGQFTDDAAADAFIAATG